MPSHTSLLRPSEQPHCSRVKLATVASHDRDAYTREWSFVLAGKAAPARHARDERSTGTVARLRPTMGTPKSREEIAPRATYSPEGNVDRR
jgi:hypothetical protein